MVLFLHLLFHVVHRPCAGQQITKELAFYASLRFLHCCPTRVKHLFPNLLLENLSLLVDRLGALLHDRVGSPDLLAVVKTFEVVLAKVGAFRGAVCGGHALR